MILTFQLASGNVKCLINHEIPSMDILRDFFKKKAKKIYAIRTTSMQSSVHTIFNSPIAGPCHQETAPQANGDFLRIDGIVQRKLWSKVDTKNKSVSNGSKKFGNRHLKVLRKG